MSLQQAFIDWNNTPSADEGFARGKAALLAQIAEKAK